MSSVEVKQIYINRVKELARDILLISNATHNVSAEIEGIEDFELSHIFELYDHFLGLRSRLILGWV